MELLGISELKFGFIDAVSYRKRGQKDLLNQMIYKEQFLDKILDENRYFLIGEKGTGKTSYAVFLENNDIDDHRAKVIYLNSTDYQKFFKLKEQGKLGVSTYSDIWRVVLLLLVCEGVKDRFSSGILNGVKFKAIQEAIDEYYQGAFKPEVDYSLELVEDSEKVLKVIYKYLEAGGSKSVSRAETQTNFQISLFAIQKKLEDALSSLKLPQSFSLFIDGIDIRPQEIGYAKYIECIRGLANATWQLNSEFFSNIRDSRGRIKVALLMRPDILDQMGFQNLNAKVRDNGIVLNWQTNYAEFRSSDIFRLVLKVLSQQQKTPHNPIEVYEHYFPYKLQNQRISERLDDPFIGILRYSFYRPRDIIQYLILMQDYIVKSAPHKGYFDESVFHKVEGDFSEYLLGEVKDYLGFYYGNVDFDQIVGFFSMFGGKNSFSWEEFTSAFHEYQKNIDTTEVTVDELSGEAEHFLQFLYSLNMVGYLEPEEFGGTFVHWCFRDRSPVKLRPKVRVGLHYTVHPGLARSLLVGRGGVSRGRAAKDGLSKGRRGRKRGGSRSSTTLDPHPKPA